MKGEKQEKDIETQIRSDEGIRSKMAGYDEKDG